MPESARQNGAAFWDVKDGRTSRAMWEMPQAFSQLEKENKIPLHFQYLDFGLLVVQLMPTEKSP